ncbi:LacI family DNA-binding transcriptional regulator [Serinibacter arcticus]|uniref:Transcriptional regulator, LacI family n=1 Tax=Serinibacter arcticus TaxID=1655435 RepID=A0A4Z1E2M2_9MICO|nr:LacI family DNA-binding transcriptional regulator [Serinibacter arcticus]TGO05469.1 Transcriptional regulator, LacI family [Serinibacter arcticus]
MNPPRRSKPPVIADVAQLAGVSVPTVSRVLTGAVPVSPERRARVLAAIAELGFRPNGAARALASGRQPMVAVIAGNTTRYGYATTIQGIEEAARAAGHMVTITVVESDDPHTVAAAVDHVLGQPLAGAVVLEYDPPGQAATRAIPAWLPCVATAAGRQTGPANLAHAYMDDRAAAEQATRYLLDLGHRTVHHIAIPSAGGESSRLQGWRDALVKSGAEVPEVEHADWAPMTAYAAGQRLVEDESVTAVLCGNDELAMAVARAVVDAGKRVPQDISVVGFDDQPLTQLWSPALTTVRQDFVQLGHAVFGLLQRQLEHGTVPASIRIVPELIVRGSTGPAPALTR